MKYRIVACLLLLSSLKCFAGADDYVVLSTNPDMSYKTLLYLNVFDLRSINNGVIGSSFLLRSKFGKNGEIGVEYFQSFNSSNYDSKKSSVYTPVGDDHRTNLFDAEMTYFLFSKIKDKEESVFIDKERDFSMGQKWTTTVTTQQKFAFGITAGIVRRRCVDVITRIASNSYDLKNKTTGVSKPASSFGSIYDDVIALDNICTGFTFGFRLKRFNHAKIRLIKTKNEYCGGRIYNYYLNFIYIPSYVINDIVSPPDFYGGNAGIQYSITAKSNAITHTGFKFGIETLSSSQRGYTAGMELGWQPGLMTSTDIKGKGMYACFKVGYVFGSKKYFMSRGDLSAMSDKKLMKIENHNSI